VTPFYQAMSRAFIRQAQSDYLVFELLSKEPLPGCHRLHYLQMWLEKLCKAYIKILNVVPS